MSIVIQSVDYLTEKEAIKQIRREVFQREQKVNPALEFDQHETTSIHLLAYWQQQPVGTTRIRYLTEDTAKIERLAVLKTARGQGIGQQLMTFAINLIQTEGKATKITIHAQEYIKNLYQKLGFTRIGEPFDEAGILHVKMVKNLSQ